MNREEYLYQQWQKVKHLYWVKVLPFEEKDVILTESFKFVFSKERPKSTGMSPKEYRHPVYSEFVQMCKMRPVKYKKEYYAINKK